MSKRIALFLVGSAREDGYLRRSLLGVSDDLAIYQGVEVSVEELSYILSVVQSRKPAGVAARSLQECLILQLERREPTDSVRLALRLLREYFDELGHKQITKLWSRQVSRKRPLGGDPDYHQPQSSRALIFQ